MSSQQLSHLRTGMLVVQLSGTKPDGSSVTKNIEMNHDELDRLLGSMANAKKVPLRLHSFLSNS